MKQIKVDRKLLVLAGYWSWFDSLAGALIGEPRRKLAGLSISTIEKPFLDFKNNGLKQPCTGIVVVYCSRWQREIALELRRWFERYHKEFTVNTVCIPATYEELEKRKP